MVLVAIISLGFIALLGVVLMWMLFEFLYQDDHIDCCPCDDYEHQKYIEDERNDG